MPASLPVKVCPFCMVDAHTDATCCAFCGSRYDQVGVAEAPRNEGAHTRRRTYDGTQHCGESAGRISLYAF
jgi:hypothetical protein